LNDDVVVLFVMAMGESAGNIMFAKGASHLGFSDKELIGSHYSELIPTTYKSFHAQRNIFDRIFKPDYIPKAFYTAGEMYLVNKHG
jgi:hypothetical protein